MHENMKTSMWHTGRSERTCRLPACVIHCLSDFVICVSLICVSSFLSLFKYVATIYDEIKMCESIRTVPGTDNANAMSEGSSLHGLAPETATCPLANNTAVR